MESRLEILVVIETQRVKHYLFASPYMRETRGASVILDRINRKEIADEILKKKYAGQYKIVYLGGGSGRVLFADVTTAKLFKKDVLALYAEEAPGAGVAVEVVRRQKNESFAAWFERGAHATQAKKLGSSQTFSMLAGRWIRPCSSCGVGPAEKPLQEHGEHFLCAACCKKRKEVREKLYRAIKPGENPDRRRALNDSRTLQKYYPKEFIFTTLAEQCQPEVFLPQDVDDIAEYSCPSNYIGFIYADGNAMGEAIKNLNSGDRDQSDEEAKTAYTAFSGLIDQATREAATEAVVKHLWEASDENAIYNYKERYLPAEFILAGGDDLMLMVPADKALDVAISFIEGFQRKTIELQKLKDYKLPPKFAEGFTTSAGVVIAHAGYPASELMELAAGLMKLAKSKAAHAGGIQEGTLDFAVVHDASTASFNQRRKTEYTQFDDGKKLILTERPYTAGGCKALLELIRGLKTEGAPRNKLKALYPVIFQGWLPAQFECRRILARLDSTGDLERCSSLRRVENDLQHFFPFRQQLSSDELTTYLSELVELYDFIHTGKSAQNPTTTEESLHD